MIVFCFDRIHRFNLPLVHALSWVGEIKSRTMDRSIPKNPPGSVMAYATIDDWNRARSEAWQQAKQEFSRFTNLKPKAQWQHRIDQIEVRYFYADLLQRYRQSSEAKNKTVIDVSRSWVSRGLDALDWLFYQEFKPSIAFLIRVLKSCILGPLPKTQTISTVVRGIAALEVPTNPGSLDFSWWNKAGLLKPESTLYVLPLPPSEASQRYLKSGNVQWILESDTFRLLSRADSVVLFFQALFFQRLWFLGSRFRLKTLLWKKIFRSTRTQRLISSLSEAWPESPETWAAKESGVKTINWSYAGSSFSYCKNWSDYKNLDVWRCLSVSDESWSWNDQVARLLQSKQIQKSPTQFISVGPIQCGDLKLLSKTPEEARRSAGLKDPNAFHLAVFDIPIRTQDSRWRIPIGPYPDLRQQERLFEVCAKILDKFPEVRLILKRKRLDDPTFEVPKARALLKGNRVIELDAKTDPYLAVAASEACIAMPFTSPPMLFNLMKKPALYFDALDEAHVTFEKVFLTQTVYRDQEVLDWVERTIKSPMDPREIARNGQALADQTYLKIRERLK